MILKFRLHFRVLRLASLGDLCCLGQGFVRGGVALYHGFVGTATLLNHLGVHVQQGNFWPCLHRVDALLDTADLLVGGLLLHLDVLEAPVDVARKRAHRVGECHVEPRGRLVVEIARGLAWRRSGIFACPSL